jgi:hypothetical protein
MTLDSAPGRLPVVETKKVPAEQPDLGMKFGQIDKRPRAKPDPLPFLSFLTRAHAHRRAHPVFCAQVRRPRLSPRRKGSDFYRLRGCRRVALLTSLSRGRIPFPAVRLRLGVRLAPIKRHESRRVEIRSPKESASTSTGSSRGVWTSVAWDGRGGERERRTLSDDQVH